MAFSSFDSIGNKSGQAITATSTTKNAQLGTRIQAVDPTTYGEGTFIYLAGCANTAVGSVVIYNGSTGATTLATARSKGPIAVAMAANTSTSGYAWYQVYGRAVVKAGTVVAGGPVYLTGTAGTVDDAVVAGDEVSGACFGTADGTPSAGFAEAVITNPWVGDTDNT